MLISVYSVNPALRTVFMLNRVLYVALLIYVQYQLNWRLVYSSVVSFSSFLFFLNTNRIANLLLY